jgi:hypothetical protein
MLDGVTGEVRIETILTTTGCIRSAAVTSSLHKTLDWSSTWAAIGRTFEPARVDGRPVDMVLQVVQSFGIKR